MRVLVIGRAGQLARALQEAGASKGLDVITVGRPEVELTDPTTLEAVASNLRPGIIINAAAYTAVDKAESERELAEAVNAQGSALLAQICDHARVPLIHVSTDYVFDGMGDRPYREDDLTGPLSVYGASKLAGERMVAARCAQHVIVRTSWVYSPWGTNFVRTMLRIAETRAEVGVVDDQIGSPTYAPHLADAILVIASRMSEAEVSAPWGCYHVVGSGEATWCGVAREVFRVAREHGLPAAKVRAIRTVDYPTAARRPANSRLDTSKLTSYFGVRMPDWQVGTAECVARIAATGIAN